MRVHYTSNQRLLDRVCYLSRAPSKDTDLFGNEITVKHTFPYNPDSKTAPTTAERWAGNTTYDHETCKCAKGAEPEKLERANDPFGITIIDLDVRSEGGRAYKVVDSQGRCFDLREDQVLEVFKHVGVLAGGQVPGQFVWGILGSQMRMVLVGGDLHKEMVSQLENLKDFKRKQASGQTPTEGSFKFGCIYRKHDQSLHLFLGRVKVPGAKKVNFAFVKLPMPSTIDYSSKLNDPNSTETWIEYARAQQAIVKRWDTMTWQERCQWNWYDQHDYMQILSKEPEFGFFHRSENITLMASPKFEEELAGMELELAEQLKANVMYKHMYVNNKGIDLAIAYNRQVHGEYESFGVDHNGYLMSATELAYAIKKNKIVKAEYVALRVQFQKKLKWI